MRIVIVNEGRSYPVRERGDAGCVTQLGLDLTGKGDRVLDLSVRRRVAMTTGLREDGIQIELEAGSGRTARAVIRVAPPAEVLTTGHLLSRWWMCDYATWRVPRRHGEVFGSIVDWVWREAHGYPRGRERADLDSWRIASATLGAGLRDVQRMALARAEPVARAAAARFRPSLRFDVYKWFVGDRSERLAQLAETSPGLVLWVMLARQTGNTSGILDATCQIQAGARPRHVLLELLARWPANAAMTADQLEARRRVIERASAVVDPAHLDLPACSLVCDDVPRDRLGAASWFRAVWRTLAGAAEDAPRIAAFVSKYATKLAHYNDRWLYRIGKRLGSLSHAYPYGLSRKHGLERTLRRSEALAAIGRIPQIRYCTELPAEPLADIVRGGFVVRRVATFGRLFAESMRMAHCVAALGQEAVAGTAAIYHADVSGERLTIHLERRGDCWQLAEVAGFANAAPSQLSYAKVLRWFADGIAEVGGA